MIFAESTQQKVHILRLQPFEDLRQALKAFASDKNLKAGFVVSGMGSLTVASLRFASAKETTILNGPFEIVSLSGSLFCEGVHLHMSVSDGKGQVFGGHLMDGSLVRTTAELILQSYPDVSMTRSLDQQTGFLELDFLR